jgi:hypothetical protein
MLEDAPDAPDTFDQNIKKSTTNEHRNDASHCI